MPKDKVDGPPLRRCNVEPTRTCAGWCRQRMSSDAIDAPSNRLEEEILADGDIGPLGHGVNHFSRYFWMEDILFAP